LFALIVYKSIPSLHRIINEILFSFICNYSQPLFNLFYSEPGKAAYIAPASKNNRGIMLDDSILCFVAHAKSIELQ
jgi:hypothetical protein